MLELLPGALPDLLRQIRPYSLPMSSMRKLALQLLTSLSFLSSQGVIHADIRPENVGQLVLLCLARVFLCECLGRLPIDLRAKW